MTNRTITRNFDSWYEFVDCVRDDSLYAWKKSHRRSSHSERDSSWAGTRTFDEAVDMAIGRGWPEGRKLMSEFLAIVAPRPEPVQSIIYDVAGAVPAVPIFCAGDPSCMMDWQQELQATHPVVRIDYCNGGIATVAPESIMLRGAAVVSLCDTLERRGYSVELRAVAHTDAAARHGRDVIIDSTVLKRAGENLDIDRLAFALAHPSVHRRFRFALFEQHAEVYNSFSFGYGATRQLDAPPADTPDGTIYIPGPSFRETPASAKLAVQIAAAVYLRGDLESAA